MRITITELRNIIKEVIGTESEVMIGDRVRVDKSHTNQHRQWLKKGLTGTVEEVNNDRGPEYASYMVRWSDGKESWVWARHNPPISVETGSDEVEDL